MKELEQRILKDGDILGGDILKVDSFLNHQLDITLLKHIGEAFYEKFKDDKVTKIVTIEASGIAIACFAALKFNVPVVFAKKAQSHNLGNEVYTSKVHSYTYDRDYDITISRKYLSEDDTIVIIDDFMANGLATEGLLDIARQAGAKVAGIGICIEKGFQPGGRRLRDKGYKLVSLAIVDEMKEGEIRFRELD